MVYLSSVNIENGGLASPPLSCLHFLSTNSKLSRYRETLGSKKISKWNLETQDKPQCSHSSNRSTSCQDRYWRLKSKVRWGEGPGPGSRTKMQCLDVINMVNGHRCCHSAKRRKSYRVWNSHFFCFFLVFLLSLLIERHGFGGEDLLLLMSRGQNDLTWYCCFPQKGILGFLMPWQNRTNHTFSVNNSDASVQFLSSFWNKSRSWLWYSHFHAGWFFSFIWFYI